MISLWFKMVFDCEVHLFYEITKLQQLNQQKLKKKKEKSRPRSKKRKMTYLTTNGVSQKEKHEILINKFYVFSALYKYLSIISMQIAN